MAYMKLVAKVKGAVTISGSQLVGNHVEGAAWISGSALRGAFAALWPGEKDDAFLDTFCRGNVDFHGLFPLPSKADEHDDFVKYSYFPHRISLSTFSCKYQPWTEARNKHKYVNAAKVDVPQCSVCGAPLKQTKAPDFYYLDGSNVKPIKQQRETFLYHGTDRKTRRAVDAALYSYTSIPDGEGFLGWLTGEKSALEEFKNQLAASPRRVENSKGPLILPLYVGRGKKRRGYLETTVYELQEGDPSFVSKIKPVLTDDKKIIVVLQTPAILYDALFIPKTTLAPEDLFPGMSGIAKCTDKEFSAMALVEGWSGVHHLPRRPDQALAAGSTFVFEHRGEWTDDSKKSLVETLFNLQKQGIGERRLEGYGQFTINPPMVR